MPPEVIWRHFLYRGKSDDRAVRLVFFLDRLDQIFAFFQWEFSLTVLAAILTVLGYSVDESIVILCRLRETFRSERKQSVTEVIDHATTSTM